MLSSIAMSVPEGSVTEDSSVGRISGTEDVARLALAQEAFDAYHARCFWFMDPALCVEKDHLPAIIDGLRRHGDRAAYRIAERLCP
jgi:hypothetical protein